MPVIEFGSAAPSTEKITASLPATRDNWPDACAMLSDDEITAILPQAGAITRTPQTVQFVADTVRNIPQGGCQFSFALPDRTDSPANTKITLMLSAVDEPDTVAAFYADATRLAGDPVAPPWGATECAYGKSIESSASCYYGNFAFSITGDTTAAGLDTPERFLTWRDEVTAEIVRTLVARMG